MKVIGRHDCLIILNICYLLMFSVLFYLDLVTIYLLILPFKSILIPFLLHVFDVWDVQGLLLGHRCLFRITTTFYGNGPVLYEISDPHQEKAFLAIEPRLGT